MHNNEMLNHISHIPENIEEDKDKYQKRDLSIRELFLYLGYDIRSESDIQKLVKNFDWLEERRAKWEKKQNYRPAIVISVITITTTAILSGVLIPLILKALGL